MASVSFTSSRLELSEERADWNVASDMKAGETIGDTELMGFERRVEST